MFDTKKAIINASKYPISIIIVGVGNSEFDAMDELDADDKLLRIGNKIAERDIVQFVPMNKFISRNGSFCRSQADLAKEVLAEIPCQMTKYMTAKNFKPLAMAEESAAAPSAPPL